MIFRYHAQAGMVPAVRTQHGACKLCSMITHNRRLGLETAAKIVSLLQQLRHILYVVHIWPRSAQIQNAYNQKS